MQSSSPKTTEKKKREINRNSKTLNNNNNKNMHVFKWADWRLQFAGMLPPPRRTALICITFHDIYISTSIANANISISYRIYLYVVKFYKQKLSWLQWPHLAARAIYRQHRCYFAKLFVIHASKLLLPLFCHSGCSFIRVKLWRCAW